FTTQADVAAQASAISESQPAPEPTSSESSAGLLHYLKFFAFHVIGLFATAAVFGGGAVATVGLLAVLALYMLGDAISGDDTSTPIFRHPRVLTVQLWLALPLLAGIVFASVWSV